MKKRIIAALAALLTLSTLTACSENTPKSGSGRGAAKKLTFEDVELTDENVENSIRLFDALSGVEENTMFSSLSLNMALGMLEAGADGSSRGALQSYLGREDYSLFASRYLASVENDFKEESKEKNGYKNVIEIANSIWADNAFPFKEEYMRNISSDFGAEIQNVDFEDKKAALKKINDWCSEKTHKMIPKILDDVDDLTAAVLVNCVYFEGQWVKEWDYDKNEKKPFTMLDGNTKDIPLMWCKAGSWFENENATAFSAHYRNGAEFIGILPKKQGDFSLEELELRSLLENESVNEYDVYAEMPRLNFENSLPLTEVLKAAGLSELFAMETADFSGISDAAMWISQILQKTKLELDEYGTRAAAVTAEILCGAAMPVEREKKSVVLDRPFAFLILDRNREILFVGKVTNP